MEKNIGIQHYKDDPSLSAAEVSKVAKWADSGAPRGNPADMPQSKQWSDSNAWRIGTPDLIVKGKDIVVKANAPDWWGEIEAVPIPLDEDRYVSAVEIREVNDAQLHANGRDTVGGRFVWHHLIYRTQVGLDTPVDSAELDTNSSDNVVRGLTVRQTGLRRAKFGEGIYVGSAESNWCGLTDCGPDRSDRNVVEENTISATTFIVICNECHSASSELTAPAT